MLLFAAVQPASEDAAPSIHIAFVTHGKRLAADTAVQTAVAAGQINGLAALFVPEYSGAGKQRHSGGCFVSRFAVCFAEAAAVFRYVSL